MDTQLMRTLVAGAVFLPWGVEVFLQVRLLKRFLETLPSEARAALPRHPRRPLLGFLGSTRFHLAVWRSFRRDQPGDAPALAGLKRRMRASVRRELCWGVAGVSTLVVLVSRGWRPWA
jgi:hypothetical protein